MNGGYTARRNNICVWKRHWHPQANGTAWFGMVRQGMSLGVISELRNQIWHACVTIPNFPKSTKSYFAKHR